MKRQSNFELLRIISIILIIAYHYGRHGVYKLENIDFSFENLFIIFLSTGGQLGVTIFILITGYFLHSSNFKFIRISRLLVYTLYYSLLGLLFSLIVLKNFNVIEIKKSLFPFVFERYWFITSYIILLFLSPYINIVIKNFSKKQLQGLIFLMIFLWCGIRTIFLAELNYSNIILFVLIYIIGAYISKYKDSFRSNYLFYLKLFLINYLTLFLLLVALNYLGIFNNVFIIYADFLVKITSIPILILSILLFLTFMKMPIFYNNNVNNVSSKIISVYLIHDNDLFRNYMWRDILKTQDFQKSYLFLFHFLFSIISIIIFSLLLDYISRKIILDRIIKKIEVVSNEIDNKIKQYI